MFPIFKDNHEFSQIFVKEKIYKIWRQGRLKNGQKLLRNELSTISEELYDDVI